MQIVTPIDVADALATELAARMPSASVHAAPAPDNIGAGVVVVETLGGMRQTAVSDLFDVVAYCYAGSYAEAMALGTSVAGEVRAIQMSGPAATGVTWTTTDANPPYSDPDPDRPTLRRATVRATVAARGVPID